MNEKNNSSISVNKVQKKQDDKENDGFLFTFRNLINLIGKQDIVTNVNHLQLAKNDKR